MYLVKKVVECILEKSATNTAQIINMSILAQTKAENLPKIDFQQDVKVGPSILTFTSLLERPQETKIVKVKL